ncbi:MAG: hypothetical protein ACK5KN_04235 [Dysgonomonas sp.]|uniref:hypothetical protein n=1 Tax=Dysgonomonas sp. TaxID=1891233 RepID=UPI003A860524
MAKETLQQIKSYEDACAYNGKQPIDEQALISLGITPKQIAGIKLEEITLALNKGTAVDIFDRERRYYPWFWTYDGPAAFAFVLSLCDDAGADAGSGSRLAYREKAASDYSGRQFIELWKEYLS